MFIGKSFTRPRIIGAGVLLIGGILLAPPISGQERGGDRGRAGKGLTAPDGGGIGRELTVPHHLQDGEEFIVSTETLLAHGEKLFSANWSVQEGFGRPLTKGNGNPLGDPTSPLVFPRNINRISGPDANSCMGCHNAPFGMAGGGGELVTGVFVLGQRFDFATFESFDVAPTRGGRDERGNETTLQTIGNFRRTLGMFGSGYIEMLARQITADLEATRNLMSPGDSKSLTSKGLSFGTLKRNPDGTWDTSEVEGLPAQALASPDALHPPDLILRPFHQAGNVISLRQFTNNAFNHHHGIQPTERFGKDIDPDGDGITNEITRADITATTLFQATMGVPGRVIPRKREVETAIRQGQKRFRAIGCAACHPPTLPLTNAGWVYTEPSPYNPPGNLRVGDAATLSVNLTDLSLPGPRLQNHQGVVQVPAFTDFKLHDICSGPADPNAEALDQNQKPGSPGFFAGCTKFITRKLWGCANNPPYFHHGKFTTLREAILAHSGEALASRQAFEAGSDSERDSVVEFLKSLQILPPGIKARVVDEHYRARNWEEND